MPKSDPFHSPVPHFILETFSDLDQIYFSAQIDSSPLWLRDSKQPDIEFLEDDIGLPGIEIKLEHIAEFSDSEDENDPEKPSNEILQEAVEDLKLYIERTKLEEEREEALEDRNESERYIKEKKAKPESKTVQINDKFDMKDVMSKFVDRMLRLLLTPEGILLIQYNFIGCCSKITDVSTLILSTNLRDILTFHFRFRIIP